MTTTVVVWELLLVSSGPIVAVIYAAVAAMACRVEMEGQFWEILLYSLLPRNTVLMTLVSMLMKQTKFDTTKLVTWTVGGWVVSYFFLRDTEKSIVQGGAEPAEWEKREPKPLILVVDYLADNSNHTVEQLYASEVPRTIIWACQDKPVAEANKIKEKIVSASNLETIAMDLTNIDSLSKPLLNLKKSHKKIDAVIFGNSYRADKVMQSAYQSTFAIVRELLKWNDAMRVVLVSSCEYKKVPTISTHWKMDASFALAMRCRFVLAKALASKYPSAVSVAVHAGLPGVFLGKTPEQLAWGPVHACLTPELLSGGYWVNRSLQPVVAGASEADQLWEKSMK